MNDVRSTEGRLNPDLKARWLEALRGDQYLQGTGFLHANGRYCCLGVLALVAGYSTERIDKLRALGSIDARLAYSLDGYGSEGDNRCKLENMNDGTNGEIRHGFGEIADWIEEHL